MRFFKFNVPIFFIVLLLCLSVGQGSDVRTASNLLDNFAQWFEEHGGTANNVKLVDFSHNGEDESSQSIDDQFTNIGVGAVGSIINKDVILEVPEDIIFCRATFAKQFTGSEGQTFKEMARKLNDAELIALFLMRERALGKESKWYPYMSIVPVEQVPAPFTFALERPEVLDAFKSKHIKNEALRIRREIEESFRRLKSKGIVEKIFSLEDRRSQRVDNSSQKKFGGLSMFIWAHSLINSRALHLRGAKFLVPFADFFNYVPNSSKRVPKSGEYFLQHHQYTPGEGFRIKSDRNLHVFGDRKRIPELNEDYGDNSNEVYTLYHAFSPMDNPFDCIKISAPVLPPAGIALQTKEQKDIARMLDFIFPGIVRKSRKNPWRWSKDYQKKLPVECIYSSRGNGILGDNRVPLQGKFYTFLALREMLTQEGLDQPYMQRHLQSCKTMLKQRAFFKGESCLQDLAKKFHFGLSLKSDLTYEKSRLSKSSYTYIMDAILAAGGTTMVRDALQSDLDRLQTLKSDRNDAPMMLAISYRLSRKSLARKIITELQSEMKDLWPEIEFESEQSSTVDGDVGNEESSGQNDSTNDGSNASGKDLDTICEDLNVWVDKNAGKDGVVKIKAKVVGGGMRIGTIATEKIPVESTYLKISSDLVMDTTSASKSSVINTVISDLKKDFPRGDPFHELLLHIIDEALVKKGNSFYRPYLASLPPFENPAGPQDGVHPLYHMDHPIYYSKKEMDRLSGKYLGNRTFTVEGYNLYKEIRSYGEQIKRKYKGVRKHVLSRFPKLLPIEKYTLTAYQWAHSILDSRAIWWHGQRHLVPLLDMVNHIEGPEGSRLHETVDEDGYATTRAAWRFDRGEQLFEDYGQPNSIYFRFHGFVVQKNSHDCVDFFLLSPSGDRRRFCLNPKDRSTIRKAFEYIEQKANLKADLYADINERISYHEKRNDALSTERENSSEGSGLTTHDRIIDLLLELQWGLLKELKKIVKHDIEKVKTPTTDSINTDEL